MVSIITIVTLSKTVGYFPLLKVRKNKLGGVEILGGVKIRR